MTRTPDRGDLVRLAGASGMTRSWAMVISVVVVFAGAGARAAVDTSAVTVDEHLGESLPLSASFSDSTGKTVRLGDYFKDGKPVVLVAAYYTCPMLCSLVLRAAANAMRMTGWTPEKQYHALTVSFDPRDTPETAAKTRATMLNIVGANPEDPAVWPFLTGKKDEVAALLKSLGFVAVWDKDIKQFAHPAVIFVISPEGKIARYLYGISYSSLDLKLSLLDASQGKFASTGEKVLMRCYSYDPSTRRYGLAVRDFMRAGSVLILVAVGLLYWIIHRQRKRQGPR